MKKRTVKKEAKGIAEKPYNFLSNFVFFLNLIVALLIITGAWLLMESEFGQSAMIFGFVMLCVSVVMRAIRWW
ncbi:MAG: hypothetical protein KKD18_06700 [Nanoarchaeota archaeon]|nr:hypothetical protein [Nanoarchaeota archaeon]MBU0978081.1 hypothetical protein [Nanoarchaeota archaeon]